MGEGKEDGQRNGRREGEREVRREGRRGGGPRSAVDLINQDLTRSVVTSST